MNKLRDFIDQNQWADTSIELRQRLWQNDQVVSANRSDFDVKSVLVVVFSVLLIVTDQLFGALLSGEDVVRDEVNQFLRMGSVSELEVDSLTVPLVSDTCAFLLGIMFEHQLLEEKECTLVINFLSDLNLRSPMMGSVSSFAVVTLQVGHDELDNECLLEHCSANDLLLNSDFNFESSRVGLGPNKCCIDHFNAFKTFHVFEAHTEKLR